LVEHDIEDAHGGGAGMEPLDEVCVAGARPLVDVSADAKLIGALPGEADDDDLGRRLDRPSSREEPAEAEGFLDVEHRRNGAEHDAEECDGTAERCDSLTSRPVDESASLDRYRPA